MYDLLLAGAFGLPILYACTGLYPVAAVTTMLALPWALSGHKAVSGHYLSGDQRVSIRATNRLHSVFSLLLLIALMFSLFR